jgi:hypothetical protein
VETGRIDGDQAIDEPAIEAIEFGHEGTLGTSTEGVKQCG